MHREISHTDEVFAPPSNLSLYALTGLLAALIGLDLWPLLADWLRTQGADVPTWRREDYPFALIAAVLGGARVLFGSLESLFEGKLGADLALAIACIAALLIPEPLIAAEVVFIGLVGECLEAFTFARTQRAVRQLVELFPRRCWRLREDGTEERVFTQQLRAGDKVVVKPGGRVPADGVVLDGRSAVDASALTGESLPVDKVPGDAVLAGSINQFGALTVLAQKVNEQTVAGRVLSLTANALKEKAPLERSADRLARYFLPVVLALAGLTFLGYLLYFAGPIRPAAARLDLRTAAGMSVYPTLAVLVVACPCALILATPAAVIAALGRLAGTGVLIKGSAALEGLAGVTAFAFDKTGTLTEGRLELGEVVPLAGVSADELLRLAASAEQSSEHPLARLILRAASERGLTPGPVEDFRASPGAGVTARIGEATLLVGTRRLLEEQNVALPPEAVAALERLDEAGQTALVVARGGTVLGVLGARDRPRPEAPAVLAELRALGVRDLVLLTGDRAAVARPLAAELGIENVHAELLPAQKAEWIARMQESPSGPVAVAMVGDGINDAPALARATVGLALGGGGTDLVAEAGDVILMGDPLRPLPLLLSLSRETVRIIRQNIVVFAFGVNLVGVVLTAWLWPLFGRSEDWYTKAPLAGVLYHQIGSLAVLLNSMRLLGFRRAGTAPAYPRLRGVLQRLDRQVGRLTNLDEVVHELSHRWRPIALGAAGLALLAFLFSGLVRVAPDEVAVVRRFGRPVADLTPGLHVRWPWPVEKVARVQPNRVRTVEIGFRAVTGRPGEGPAAGDGALTWASPHGGEGFQRLSDESVMITGDGNLVELLATVRFRVSDPRRYLFEVREPDELVRSAAEAALRDTAAAEPFLELLTTRRADFQRQVFERLARRCAAYDERGLGVVVEGVSLHDLHPPGEVVPAFHAVAKAMEQRDRKVNDAQAAALRKHRDAEAEAQRVVRQAQASAHKTVEDAKVVRDTFLAWDRARTQLPAPEEAKLLGDAFRLWLGGQPAAATVRAYLQQRRERVTVQAFLIDFRLSWEVLTRVLAGRDKIIIDADRVPGRRQLLLIDPELLRPPPVILPPRSMGGPREEGP